MSRTLRAMAFLVLVSGCGARSYDAPRELDDACAIVAEYPDYLRAFRATERTWGVPVAVQMAIIYQESKFVGDARTPFQWTLGVIPAGRMSSAFGFAQALDGTWEEYQTQQGGRRARRDDIGDATDFMGWYMSATQRELGIALNDTRNQYLAYHEGRGGYRRGTYREKAWLMRVAGELEDRALLYHAQLSACNRI